jgi:hypothetical protein
MRNPIEVLRQKEKELLQVRKEIEALRTVLPLLGEEESIGEAIASFTAHTTHGTRPAPRAMPFP